MGQAPSLKSSAWGRRKVPGRKGVGEGGSWEGAGKELGAKREPQSPRATAPLSLLVADADPRPWNTGLSAAHATRPSPALTAGDRQHPCAATWSRPVTFLVSEAGPRGRGRDAAHEGTEGQVTREARAEENRRTSSAPAGVLGAE